MSRCATDGLAGSQVSCIRIGAGLSCMELQESQAALHLLVREEHTGMDDRLAWGHAIAVSVRRSHSFLGPVYLGFLVGSPCTLC